jgi:peptidoglycan/xylan/chitin deacetylase (PgdA/CDA1 family)
MYHRISEDSDDPFQLCVTPAHFRDQLNHLRAVTDIVPLDDLLKPVMRGAPPRAAITFDDGYADNLHQALPVAEAAGVPITVYVTSRAVGAAKGFWWDRLWDILRCSDQTDPVITVDIGGARLQVGALGPGWRQTALTALHTRLLPQSPSLIDRVLGDVAIQVGSDDAIREAARPLTPTELCELAEHPLVTIGAHTREHAQLSTLAPASQFATMAGSRSELQEMTGRAVIHFAYPFGGRDAVNKESFRAAGQAGFATACTTLSGRVTRRSDPLRLPRLMVFDEAADAFAARLARYGFP